VKELVVAGVGRTRGPKNDALDALGLAQALRIGAIETRVHKGLGRYKKLRQLARVHRMIVGDVVRVQNRLKCLYRSWGVATAGKRFYSERERGEWLKKLDPTIQPAAMTLYDQFDALSRIRKEARRALIVELHRHPISRLLETAPGLGPIRVAEIVSIVVTPHRFRTARQFWSYCGLGIVMRSSSDWIQSDGNWKRAELKRTRGLNRNFNRDLKAAFKGAATTVITKLASCPLRVDYDRLLEAGTKPNLAKLTLARKIAATALAMWKNEEVYDLNRHRVNR
jgi:transposase